MTTRSLLTGVTICGLLASCATPTTLRELPTSLSPSTSALLQGCEVHRSDFDVDILCADGLRIVRHRQATGREATWLAAAEDEAAVRQARLEWVDDALDSDDARLPLRNALLHRADDDTVIANVYATSRPVDDESREDLWCIGDARHQARCKQLLLSMLATPPAYAPYVSTSRVLQPQLLGRSVSLSTVCVIEAQSAMGGHYRCDAVTLAWRVAESMEDAVSEAEAIVGSLGDDVFDAPCRLGYEKSRCQVGTLVAVGVAWVDGVAISASCVGDGDPPIGEVSGCASLLNLGEQ